MEDVTSDSEVSSSSGDEIEIESSLKPYMFEPAASADSGSATSCSEALSGAITDGRLDQDVSSW